MADLIKAFEADLFGAYEWAVDQYTDLATVKDPATRLVVALGLMRAHAGLDDAAAAEDAAGDVVSAEEDLPEATREVVTTVQDAREALLDAEEPDDQVRLARAFLDAFDAEWARGKRDALVPDALLAALVRANLLASRGQAIPGAPAALTGRDALVRDAARLYEEVGAILRERVDAGEIAWQETTRACHHRAMVAWRMLGDEARAEALEKAAERFGGGGAAWYR